MCLVLKLDNGKVVSIADEQTDRHTEPPSTVLVYSMVLIRLRCYGFLLPLRVAYFHPEFNGIFEYFLRQLLKTCIQIKWIVLNK